MKTKIRFPRYNEVPHLTYAEAVETLKQEKTKIRFPRYNEVPHLTYAEAVEQEERRHEAFMQRVEKRLASLPPADCQKLGIQITTVTMAEFSLYGAATSTLLSIESAGS